MDDEVSKSESLIGPKQAELLDELSSEYTRSVVPDSFGGTLPLALALGKSLTTLVRDEQETSFFFTLGTIGAFGLIGTNPYEAACAAILLFTGPVGVKPVVVEL